MARAAPLVLLWALSSSSSSPAAPAPALGRSALTFLEWDAPAGCAAAAAVYQRVAAAVGYPPERGRFQRVRGVVRAEKSSWTLTLELFEGAERRIRSITAETCGGVESAAAVAIALALGSEGSVSEPSSRPSSESTTAPAERTSSATEADATAAPQLDASSREALISIAALLDTSSLAGASGGVGIDARFAWGRVELGARAIWLPATQREVRANQSVQFELFALGPRLCYRALDRAIVLSGCAGADIGRFSADGAGLARNVKRFEQLWLAPSIGVELRSELLDGLIVTLGADALRPLIREGYSVNGGEVVYGPPDVSLRAQVGVGLSTP